MCDSWPEVPVKIKVGVVAPAVAAAVSVTLCAVPGVSDNVAGLLVTPAGSPVIATDTVAEKLLAAVAVTLTGCPATPAVSVTLLGAMVKEKSGVGDGVGVGGVVESEYDPPHETSDSENRAAKPMEFSQENCETRNWHPIRPKLRQ